MMFSKERQPVSIICAIVAVANVFFFWFIWFIKSSRCETAASHFLHSTQDAVTLGTVRKDASGVVAWSQQEADDFEQLESSSFADLKKNWASQVLKEIIDSSASKKLSILELLFCKPGKCEPTITLREPNEHSHSSVDRRVHTLDVSAFVQQHDASIVYDIVVCIDVFPRVADPVKVFKEIAKVLRNPGGILLATSPFSGNFRPRSGPPILAKLGNLWFEKMAQEQKLTLTHVWSEGSYEDYMKELSQKVMGCGAIPKRCREGWHRGFMVRIEKGSGSWDARLIEAPPHQLPPCKARESMSWHHLAWNTWMRQFPDRGNPGNRDYWIREKITSLCGQKIDGQKPKVLDVSAGNRPYKGDFEAAGCQYFSNEFGGNEQIMDTLRNEVSKNLKMHDYLGPDITNTTAPSSHFDIVILTEVLEHVPDALAAVRELRRVAKKGASILLTSPLTSGPHQLPFHFAAGYSEYWYIAVAHALGLGVVSLEPQGDVYAVIRQECAPVDPIGVMKDMQPFYAASLSPEHAIGWVAHLRKD